MLQRSQDKDKIPTYFRTKTIIVSTPESCPGSGHVCHMLITKEPQKSRNHMRLLIILAFISTYVLINNTTGNQVITKIVDMRLEESLI